MRAVDPYECRDCEGTGHLDDGPCDDCDGTGITAIDCPGCGQQGVPIHETVFVAAHPKTYCEACGDRELERIAASLKDRHARISEFKDVP